MRTSSGNDAPGVGISVADGADLPFLRFDAVTLPTSGPAPAAVEVDPDDEFGPEEAEEPETPDAPAAPPPMRPTTFAAGPGEAWVIRAPDAAVARLVLDLACGAKHPSAGLVTRRGSLVALHRIRVFSASEDGRLSVLDRLAVLIEFSGWGRAAVRDAAERACAEVDLSARTLSQSLARTGLDVFRALALRTALLLRPDILMIDSGLWKEAGRERRTRIFSDFTSSGRILVIASEARHPGCDPFEPHRARTADAILSAGKTAAGAQSGLPLVPARGWAIELEAGSGGIDAAITVAIDSEAGGTVDSVRLDVFAQDTPVAQMSVRPVADIAPAGTVRIALGRPTVPIDRADGASVTVSGWAGGAPLLLVRGYALGRTSADAPLLPRPASETLSASPVPPGRDERA